MITTESHPNGAGAPPRPRRKNPRRRPWLKPLILRIHFYAGLFVAPFIALAALTGAAYALTPQLEKAVYAHELFGSGHAGDAQLPLSAQIAAAQEYTGNAAVRAVRPAPSAELTTRVLYPAPQDPDGGSRTVFVDPVSGEIRGELQTYTSQGQTPLRHWLEGFHSSLHLGAVGKYYSELAASWMGIVAAAGLFLWLWTWRQSKRKARADMIRPARGGGKYRRARSLHLSVGAWVLLAMLFLSATGITWSGGAGANVSALRSALSWTAPTLKTSLGGSDEAAGGAHAAHHGGAAPAQGENQWSNPAAFEQVLSLARMANIDGTELEIRPPASAQTAWVVKETRSQAPAKADAVAIDRANGTVVDRLDFGEQNLASKLSTWGISLHMGELLGLPNQIGLFVAAIGILVVICAGYAAWWRRRPHGTRLRESAPRFDAGWVPWWGWLITGAVAVGLGLFLPLVGWSLLAFLAADGALHLLRRRKSGSRRDTSGAIPEP